MSFRLITTLLLSLTFTSVLTQSIIPITPTTTSPRQHSSSTARDYQSVLMLFNSTHTTATTASTTTNTTLDFSIKPLSSLSKNRQSLKLLRTLTSFVINLSSPSAFLLKTIANSYSMSTIDGISSSVLPTVSPVSSVITPQSRVVTSSSITKILKSSCFSESPRVYQPLLGSSKSIATSCISTHTMIFNNTAISPTSVMEISSLITTIPRDTSLSSSPLIASLSRSPTPTINVSSLLNVLMVTSTLSPISSRMFSSSEIELLETVLLPSPSPTEDTNQESTAQTSLFYIGVAVGIILILVTAATVAVVSFCCCCRTKKYEYSTGNEYRVTVQRYNPNIAHYTAGNDHSDSVFSSRGSSIRSSFGFSPKGRRQSLTGPDHVTTVINLEMFSTPM